MDSKGKHKILTWKKNRGKINFYAQLIQQIYTTVNVNSNCQF